MEKLDRFLLFTCCAISQQTKGMFLQVLNHFVNTEEEILLFLKTANLKPEQIGEVKEQIKEIISSIEGLGTFAK